MITMQDPSLTVYPNRQQMLALIEARAAATQDRADQAEERYSGASETPPWPNCIAVLE
jgi:hypothetical protein